MIYISRLGNNFYESKVYPSIMTHPTTGYRLSPERKKGGNRGQATRCLERPALIRPAATIEEIALSGRPGDSDQLKTLSEVIS
jgi:hypothetical protein